LVPLYLLIYGPTRILEWITRFPGAYGYSPFPTIAILMLIGLLGGFGFLWSVIFYFFLSRARRKEARLFLYLFQFPGVWLLVNLLSLIFVLPYAAIMYLLKIEGDVASLDLLLTNNFSAILFAIIFYKIQERIYLVWGKR